MHQISHIVVDSISQGRIRTVLKSKGITGFHIFDTVPGKVVQFNDNTAMMRALFDKLKQFSRTKAKFIFQKYQIENVLQQAQIEVRYIGILPTTVKVHEFIKLIWTKLKILIKTDDENSIPNVLSDVVIIPYIAWLEKVCEQKNNAKYKNIVVLENVWWLDKFLDQMTEQFKGGYFSQIKKQLHKMMAVYSNEIYFYEFSDPIIMNLISPLRGQLPKDPQFLSQQVSIDALEKVFFSFYTITTQGSDFNCKNKLQIHIEKILKRMQKHLCSDTLSLGLMSELLRGELKNKIQ